MSFSKTVQKTLTITKVVTTDLTWIKGDTEPTAPTGYERAPELDLDFGLLGKYWAFLKIS